MNYEYKFDAYLSKTMEKIFRLIEDEYGENESNVWSDIRKHNFLNSKIKIDQVEVKKKRM